jgi:hypothetical protein
MEKSIVQKSIGRKSIVRKRASYREALAEKSIVQNETSTAHGVTGSRCSMKAHCSMKPLRGTTKQKAKRKMARSDHGPSCMTCAKRFSRPRRPKDRWNKQKAQLLITERHRHGISNAKAWARVSPKWQDGQNGHQKEGSPLSSISVRSDDVSRAGETQRYGLTSCQKANTDKEVKRKAA